LGGESTTNGRFGKMHGQGIGAVPGAFVRSSALVTVQCAVAEMKYTCSERRALLHHTHKYCFFEERSVSLAVQPGMLGGDGLLCLPIIRSIV
jgi:hypothetical protein